MNAADDRPLSKLEEQAAQWSTEWIKSILPSSLILAYAGKKTEALEALLAELREIEGCPAALDHSVLDDTVRELAGLARKEGVEKLSDELNEELPPQTLPIPSVTDQENLVKVTAAMARSSRSDHISIARATSVPPDEARHLFDFVLSVVPELRKKSQRDEKKARAPRIPKKQIEEALRAQREANREIAMAEYFLAWAKGQNTILIAEAHQHSPTTVRSMIVEFIEKMGWPTADFFTDKGRLPRVARPVSKAQERDAKRFLKNATTRLTRLEAKSPQL